MSKSGTKQMIKQELQSMGQIKVDTATLRGNASELNASSSELSQIISDLNRVSSNVHNAYNGQLASQLEAISSQAQRLGSDYQTRLTELSTFLTRRADAFDAVDEENENAMTGLSLSYLNIGGNSPVLSIMGTLIGLSNPFASFLWSLGASGIGPLRDWISFIPPLGWFQNAGVKPEKNSNVPPKVEQLTINVPKGVNFRRTAEVSKSNIIQTLPYSATVTVKPNSKPVSDGIHTWVEVTYNGNTGWIAKDVLLPTIAGKEDFSTSTTISIPANLNTELARKVTGDDGRRTLSEVPKPKTDADAVALYYRGDPIKSNCTWYAAAAVNEVHGIPLNSGKYGSTGSFSSSLGHGGKWASNAEAALDENNPLHNTYKEYQPYINEVDKVPRPNSVLSLPGTIKYPEGHVLFVEDVQLVEKDGKKYWELAISEENWGGENYFPGAQIVEVSSDADVKRWVRSITLEMNSSGEAQTNGKFIHFRNSK